MKKAAEDFIGQVSPEWKVGIIYSSFYPQEVGSLLAEAQKTLLSAGLKKSNIYSYIVPGSFEIPLLGSVLAKKKKADALIGLGIIVQGETKHADLIARETARGIMEVQLTYNIPFAFEVLYVKNIQQARERSFEKNNKGREAAVSVLHTLSQLSLFARQRN